MRRLLPIVLFVAACSDDGIKPSDTSSSNDASTSTDASVATDASTPNDTTTSTSPPTDTSSPQETEVSPPSIGWAILQFPASHSGEPGSALSIYGRVFAQGVTDGAGQGAGITAEVGLGTGAVDGWSWSAAQYNVDADGANDEYLGNLQLPNTDGEYRYTFRFRLGDGAWVYADLDSTDNGFDVNNTGVATVVTPDPEVVDWCNLQFPAAITANPGAPVGTIYGQVYDDGVTNAINGNDEAYLIGAQLGWGTGDDVTTWTWVDAQYAKDVGNNDEFEATFAAPAVGTYRYAYRFDYRFVLTETWVYCDLTGLGDGFSVADSGTLTVEPAPPKTIDYAVLRPATATWAASEPAPQFEVVVYEAGVTEGVGKGAGIEVTLRWQSGFENGSQTALYTGDENGLGTNDNDVYALALPTSLEPGTYDVTATVKLQDGDPVEVDATGTADGFDAADAAVATITPSVDPIPDYCRIVGPELSGGPPGTASEFRVQVYEAGMTPGSSTIDAEVGLIQQGVAGAQYAWSAASFASSEGNDDYFAGSVSAPAGVEATFVVAGRARIGEGPWLQCDGDGSSNGFDPANGPRLESRYERVDYCRIQFPTDDVGTVPLSAVDVYGVVYEPGMTGVGGVMTRLRAEVGFGAPGSTPDATWTWAEGAFNVYADNGFGEMNNSEYKGQLVPTVPGLFAWAWRFSIDDGTSWLYCDEAGTQPYDPSKAGVLDVGE